jgi:GTP-binding protein HflX
VIDLSYPEWEEQKTVVDGVLEELELGDRPQILLFNKIDRLTHAEQELLQARVRQDFPIPALFVSAVEKGGLDPLLDELRERVRTRFPEVHLDLPASAGDLIAAVHREGEVITQREEDARIHLTARIPETLLWKLQKNPAVVLAGR